METIKLKINGIEVTAPKGSTILEAARLAHIEIPTLCFLKEINEIGACRVCIVELKMESWLLPAYILRKTEWKYLPILQRSWIPEKDHPALLSNHNRFLPVLRTQRTLRASGAGTRAWRRGLRLL